MSKRGNELNQMDKYEHERHEQDLEESSGDGGQVLGQGFQRAEPATLQQGRILKAARPHGSSSNSGNGAGSGRNAFENINIAAPRPAAAAAPAFSFGTSTTTTAAAAAPAFSFGSNASSTMGVGVATASSNNNNSGASGNGGPPVGSINADAAAISAQKQINELYAAVRSKVMNELLVHHAAENWSGIFQNALMAEHMLAKQVQQMQQQSQQQQPSGSGSNGAAPPCDDDNNNNAPQQQQQSSVPAFSFGAPPAAASAAAAAPAGGFSFSSTSSTTVGGGGSSGGGSGGGFTFGGPPAAAVGAAAAAGGFTFRNQQAVVLSAPVPPVAAASAANPFAPAVAPGGGSGAADADATTDAPVEDNKADAVQPAETDPAWDEVDVFYPVIAYRLKDIKDASKGLNSFAPKGKLYIQKSTLSNTVVSPPGQCRLLMRDSSGMRVLINMLLQPDICNLQQEFKEKDPAKPTSKAYSVISFTGDNMRGPEQIRLKTSVPVGRQLYQTLRETIGDGCA